MKRKMLLIPLVLLLAISLVAMGCPAPAPPTPAPPAPAPPAPAPRLTFTFASYRALTHSQGVWFGEYCDKVGQATDGQVEFKYYPGESLVKKREQWSAVTTGTVDITSTGSTDWSKVMPWGNIFSFPEWAKDTADGNAQVEKAWSILEEEFEGQGLKLLWVIPVAAYINMYSRIGFIKTIDDFEGILVRNPGGMTALVMNEWGAATVTLSPADQYTAIQRGTCDATVTGAGSAVSYRVYEVAPYITLFKYPIYIMTEVCNMKAWKTIPPDLQGKILEVGREMQAYCVEQFDGEYEKNMKVIIEGGGKTYEPTLGLRKELVEKSRPVWDRYLEECGPTAQKLYDLWYR